MRKNKKELEIEIKELKLKHNEVLEFCKPHLKLMWAASVVGIIKGCDFRDAAQNMESVK